MATAADSGNAVGAGRVLKRMKLAWKDREYKFAINPEDYTQSEPNKATITQTKGGAWIDAWGEGIKEITIKGTTGVFGDKSSELDGDTGYRRWKELRDLVQAAYDSVQDGEKVDLMELYNYTDNEYFYVYPSQGGIELYRSKARPHIYQYTLHLWAVRRIGQPEVERQVLGNPVKYMDAEISSWTQIEEYAKLVQSGEMEITQLIQYAKKLSGATQGDEE